jgi:hypothetical protein
MERSEGFKSSVATIKALEGQLAACGRVLKECERAEVKAEQEIEEHFEKCMNALAARKATLLRTVEERVSTRSMFHMLHYTQKHPSTQIKSS